MDEQIAWVLRARQGDEEAFTRLVEAFQTPVHNLCLRMLGEERDAEDAAQETFLRAYRHLNRYDEARPFGTWILSIAAHYCIDRLRKRRLQVLSLDEEDEEGATLELPDPDSPQPEVQALRREERERIHGMLQHLDEVDRAAIVMRYWNGSAEVEIAEALHLTVSAVKSRLHRARRALGERWQEGTSVNRPQRRPHESPAV